MTNSTAPGEPASDDNIDHGEVDDTFYILRRIAYYDCENEEPGHMVTIPAVELRELLEALDAANERIAEFHNLLSRDVLQWGNVVREAVGERGVRYSWHCPICDKEKGWGHTNDCPIGAALAKKEKAALSPKKGVPDKAEGKLTEANERIAELNSAIQDVHKTAFEGFAGHRQSCDCAHCTALDALFNVWSNVTAPPDGSGG